MEKITKELASMIQVDELETRTQHYSVDDIVNERNLQFRLDSRNIFALSPMDFKQGGTGYVLYLEMIRYFSLVFLIIALITIPVYVYLYKVYYYNLDNDLPSYIPHLTEYFSIDILQYGAIYQFVSFDESKSCQNLEKDENITLMKNSISKQNNKGIEIDYSSCFPENIYTSTDNSKLGVFNNWLLYLEICSITACLFLVASVIYHSIRTKAIIEDIEDITISPSKFTLEFWDVPANATKNYISNLAKNAIIQSGDIPTSEFRASTIKQVNIAYNLSGVIKNIQELLDAIKKLKSYRAMRKNKNFINSGMNYENSVVLSISNNQDLENDDYTKELYENVKLEYSKCLSAVENDTKHNDAVFAFVTFDKEKTARDLLHFYDMNQDCKWLKTHFGCCCCRYPESLRWYEDDSKTYVIQAAHHEPADVKWENIGHTFYELWRDYVIVIVILVTVIALCVLIYVLGLDYEKNMEVPDCVSIDNSYHTAKLSPFKNIPLDYFNSSSCQSSSECQSDGIQRSMKAILDNQKYKYCYCFFQMPYMWKNFIQYESVCSYELLVYSKVRLIPLVMSMFTIIMNYVIYYAAAYSIPFSKPYSRTVEIGRITLWVFIGQFVNMAVIPLIIDKFHVVNGDYYNTIGLAMLSNFFLYTVTPNLTGLVFPMFYYWYGLIYCKIYSVDPVEEAYIKAGPDFLDYIYIRYSYYLVYVSIIIIFATSFPILYVLGALGLCCMYYIEKLNIVFVYRKVDFSADMDRVNSGVYSWLIVLQCVWACIVYNNWYFFPSPDFDPATYSNPSNLFQTVYYYIISIGYRNIVFVMVIGLVILFKLSYIILEFWDYCGLNILEKVRNENRMLNADTEKIYGQNTDFSTTVDSYNIEDKNNLKYKDIITTLRSVQKLSRTGNKTNNRLDYDLMNNE